MQKLHMGDPALEVVLQLPHVDSQCQDAPAYHGRTNRSTLIVPDGAAEPCVCGPQLQVRCGRQTPSGYFARYRMCTILWMRFDSYDLLQALDTFTNHTETLAAHDLNESGIRVTTVRLKFNPILQDPGCQNVHFHYRL